MGSDPLDIAVVGAGPVGAMVAALAARPGVRVEVFEARPSRPDDARTLALSHASRELIESVDAWPADRSTPITSIHVSQKGSPGRTLMTAADMGLAALGHTLPFAALVSSLSARLQASAIPVHYGRSCEAISLDAEGASLRFSAGHETRARLLVLADGGANASRIPGIAFREKDYGQFAVVGKVATERAHEGLAYERFTGEGPIALLPLRDRYAFVWTTTPRGAERLLALDDKSFLAALQEHFGDRAGRFSAVADRARFPLRLRAINTPVALRTILVGNAAQALHPIAGQGLNLGLRDAQALAAIASSSEVAELGGPSMLERYRAARARDASRGIAFTDFLVSSFDDSSVLPGWGRGLGLTALDLIPAARRALARRMLYGAEA